MTKEEKEEKTEGEFDPACVNDIYDKLHSHNFALRAFGALLATSDMDDFAEGSYGEGKKDMGENLRWGLSQIIDLYLAHQEKILLEYCDQYNKSDLSLIHWAKINISTVEHGGYRMRDAAAESVYQTLRRLDIVINRGGELKEKAAALRVRGLEILKGMVRADIKDQEMKARVGKRGKGSAHAVKA